MKERSKSALEEPTRSLKQPPGPQEVGIEYSPELPFLAATARTAAGALESGMRTTGAGKRR